MKKLFMALNILIAAFIMSTQVEAARVSVTTTISRLYTYSEQVGFDGDIAIKIANPPIGCAGGFWVRSSTTMGYKNTVAFLLSAFHTGAQVHLGGLDDEIWKGSTANYCRLDEMSLIK